MKIRHHGIIIVLMLVFALASSTTSTRAYVPMRWGAHALGAWRAESFPLTFYINEATVKGISNLPAGGNAVAAVRAALGSWQSVQTAVIRFADLQSTPVESASDDGINLITMAATDRNREILGGDLGAVSMTRLAFNPATGEITEADILLNPGYRFSTDLTPGTYDLQAVVTHELGHALGADHSAAQSDTMFSEIGPGDFHQRDLSADAVAFAGATYPDRARFGSTGTISGRVATGGRGIFGASVTAVNLDRNTIYTALSEPDGTYAMQGVSAGTYAIYAEPLDGPATPDQLTVQGMGAYYSGLNTAFRTTFEQTRGLGVEGAPRHLAVDFAVSTAAPTLNIDRMGYGDPDSGIGYLSRGPVVVSPGDTVELWIGGQDTWKVARIADLGILGTGAAINPARPLRVLRNGSGAPVGIAVSLQVAPDAAPGARTVTLRVGDQVVAGTGGILVAARGLPAAKLYFPYVAAGPDRYTGIAVVNPAETAATVRASARDSQGALLWSQDAVVPSDFSLAGKAQAARLERQIFNLPGDERHSGSAILESEEPGLQAFFLAGDLARTFLDGAEAFTRGFRTLCFVDVLQNAGTTTDLHLMNTRDAPETVELTLVGADGNALIRPIKRTIPALGKISEPVGTLFGFTGDLRSAHVIAEATDDALAGFSLISQAEAVFGLNAQPADDAGPVLFSPQFAIGDLGLHFETRLNLVNAADAASAVTVALLDQFGNPLAAPRSFTIGARAQFSADARSLFGLTEGIGYVRVSAAGGRLLGNVVFGNGNPALEGLVFGAALPLSAAGSRSFLFAQIAQGSGYYTGLAFVAPDGAKLTIDAYDANGIMIGSTSPVLAPAQRLVSLLQELIPGTEGQVGGYIRVSSDRPVIGFELFGTADGQLLSAVPPQRLER